MRRQAVPLAIVACLALLVIAQTNRIADPTAVTGRSIVGSYWACSAAVTNIGGGVAAPVFSIHAPNGNTNSCYVKRITAIVAVQASCGFRVSRTSALPTGATNPTAVLHKTSDAAATCVVTTSPTATNTGGDFVADVFTTGTHNWINATSEFSDVVVGPNQAIEVRTDATCTSGNVTVCVQWDEGTGS